jgi:hypothetical protein
MAQEPATKTDGPQRPGRPSTYTSSIAEQICERIAEGEPLTKICRDEQIPAYRTVLGWRVANKEFSQMYARARLDAGDTEYGDRTRMDMSASLEVTTRPVDHMPEWMKQELEKASRSISKEAESTGNPAPPSPRPRRRQRR